MDKSKNEPRLKRSKEKFQAFTDYTWVVGTVLRNYNSFEKMIDDLIYNYYKPSKNTEQFKNILLNSSILGMGQKCKVLSNMNDFDNKIVEKIKILNSIRNGIAHCNAGPHISLHFNTAKNPDKTIFEVVNMKNIIKVMNSSGQIKSKELENQYDEFARLEHDISIYVKQYIAEHLEN